MKDSRPLNVYYLNYMVYFRGVLINTIINRLANIRNNSVIGPCVSDVALMRMWIGFTTSNHISLHF